MKTFAIVTAVALVLVFGQTLLAAPQPPIYVVNHSTKECGTIMGGDECMDCFPLEGWQVVDRGDGWCPEGYAQVRDVGAQCEHFKDQFCCTEGHSGVPGDCRDLIRHDSKRQCAFVDDIETAVIPRGWTQGPENGTAHSWVCPNHYEWVTILEPAPTAEPEPTATEGPGPTEVTATDGPEPTKPAATEGPEPTKVTATAEAGPRDTTIPCLGAFLLGPAALGLVLVARRESGDAPSQT